jgi:hypothetical protein
MKFIPELEGLEFDWFAADQEGNFALFATAGTGPVPEHILDTLDQHNALGTCIPVSGWGTDDVWKSYARVGLFAYDWHDGVKAYLRVAEPSQALDTQLSIELCTSVLPQLPLLFRASGIVQLPVDAPSGK